MTAKPLPTLTAESHTFWEGTARGELWLPWCTDTGRAFFPPREHSPYTGGGVAWRRASGRAVLASYIVVARPAPGFEGEVPYVVAIAELEEGPRLLTNLPGADPSAMPPIGAPLEVGFEERGDLALPQFHLVGDGS